MPMPTVADNPIFQPGSGFFSWQKVIEANKDRSKQVGEEFNKSLEQKTQSVLGEQENAKRQLEAEKADIQRTKQEAADYASGKFKSYDPTQQARAKEDIARVAKEGYKFDASRYQKPLENVAKAQADLKAAQSVAGRLGQQSGALPTQADLFNQVAYLQGGAGSNVEPLLAKLQGTSNLLQGQIGEVGQEAAGAQKAVVDPLTELINKQKDPAKKAAINLGRGKVQQAKEQVMGSADLKRFGDPNAYRQAGIDLNQFITGPNIANLTDEELMAYGAPGSNEYQTLQDTYKLLGLTPEVLNAPKQLELNYDIAGAQKRLGEINKRKADQAALSASSLQGGGVKPGEPLRGRNEGTFNPVTNQYEVQNPMLGPGMATSSLYSDGAIVPTIPEQIQAEREAIRNKNIKDEQRSALDKMEFMNKLKSGFGSSSLA